MAQKWTINIDKLSQGGFAPMYWENNYPTFGNKNMAADMTNIDMTSAHVLHQGPGLSTLGDQTGNVSTAIKGINEISVASDSVYGVGSNKLYPISSSAVSSPHPITGTSPVGEDVCYYNSALFYSYNDSGSGDIGRFPISGTWDSDCDDDWWTAAQSGTALQDAPHPMVSAGTSGVLYIGNGQYVAEWDGTTAVHDTFNTYDSDSEVVDLAWNQNRLFVASNRKNLSGNNRNEASVYLWDGNSAGWTDRVEVLGKIGALVVKNGITFVIYKKNLSQGVITLGYINGTQIEDVFNWQGTLPNFYQTTRYKDLILMVSGGSIYAWGGGDVSVETRGFQLASAGHSNGGGITNAFGIPIVTSDDGSTNYKVAEFSGYTTTSDFKGLTFGVYGSSGQYGKIDALHFRFEELESGARVDYTVKDNGGDSLGSGIISYANDGAVTSKTFGGTSQSDNFRLELDYSNGSTSKTVKIKSIQIKGHTIND